jgi:hypothetical protein
MVNHTDGYVLNVYVADRGSATADKMVALSALAARNG